MKARFLGLLCAAAAPAVADFSFTSMGDVPDTYGQSVIAATQDGTTVFGGYDSRSSSFRQFYKWSMTTGFQPITIFGWLQDVSGDGETWLTANNDFGWRKRPDGFWQALFREYSGWQAAPHDMSRDGAYVVGEFRHTPYYTPPVYWDVESNYHYLSYVPFNFATARSISPNGIYIGGYSGMAYNDYQGAIWNRLTGEMRILPSYANTTESRVYAVSNDGRVAIGSIDQSFALGCRWVDGRIEPLPSGDRVGFLSADGSLVAVGINSRVGLPESPPGLWTETTGSIKLKDYLQYSGVPGIDALRFSSINWMSDDGQVIVGNTVLPSNTPTYTGYVARIERPTGIVQPPGTVNLLHGTSTSGGQSDLFGSDDRCWLLHSKRSGTGAERISLQFATRIPMGERGGFQFHIESTSAQSPRMAIEFYDFRSRQWVLTCASGSGSLELSQEANNLPNRFEFVQAGSRRVLARVSWTEYPYSKPGPFDVAIDQVKWMIIH